MICSLPISLSLSLSSHFFFEYGLRARVCVLASFHPYSCFTIDYWQLHKKPTGCEDHVFVPVTRTNWQGNQLNTYQKKWQSQLKQKPKRSSNNRIYMVAIHCIYMTLYRRATTNNWIKPRHSGVRCNVFILECTKHKITWGGTYQNGAAFCDQYFFNDSFMHHNSIDSSQLHFSFGFRIECASQHIARLSVPYIFTNWHNYFLVFAQIKATASVDAFAALFSLSPSRFPSIHIWHSWKTINSITHCISFRYSL